MSTAATPALDILPALQCRAAALRHAADALHDTLAAGVDADPLRASRWLARLDELAHQAEDLADEAQAAAPTNPETVP